MEAYLGVDVGSVSTNLVVLGKDQDVLVALYRRTMGRPIQIVQETLKEARALLPPEVEIVGVGTTGSGRALAGVVLGADLVKNEITSHAVAASLMVPGVQTILEIGGQDSKIILLRNGVVVDFSMNSVCAAGTGSFLDQQASRLNIPIEDFGSLALQSQSSVRIAGRCTVFAESDMIHKQQMGHNMEDIIAGLCEALVRNYLNNVGKGKEIVGPVSFQGGVAANAGIKAAFEESLGIEVIVPNHFGVMGALGAAYLGGLDAREKGNTSFKGFEASNFDYRASSFECRACPNLCEVINIKVGNKTVGRWGGRCSMWEDIVD